MAFVTHRGARIHYDVQGPSRKAPTVVLQHGLFSRGSRFALNGYVEALADDYRVVCIDSLGHGDSDKPSDPSLYSRRQRGGDVLAVIDAIGAERVHLVGYSMGGWIATAVAIHHPERLASLTIGGWDPIGGVKLPTAGTERPRIEHVLAAARARVPDLVEWITSEVEPALAACWNALFELDGVDDALRALRCPVLLWSGVDDLCHESMKSLAEANGFAFLSTRGDHAGAMVLETARVVERWRGLFEEAQ